MLMHKSSGYRKDLGNWGEDFARQWLVDKGYCLIKQNYHCRYGEIDLIMRIDDSLVAVEVKTRRTDTYGHGEDSVTPKKLKSLFLSMQSFLSKYPELPDTWQLDVLVVEPVRNLVPVVHHYENVSIEGVR